MTRPSIPSAFALLATLALVTGATVTKPPVPKNTALKQLRSVSSVVVPQPVNVLLSVDYPVANQGPDVVFHWYSSTNIVNPVWLPLTNTPAMSVVIQMFPGAMSFKVSAYSIFWQEESPPSPVASTPPAPTPPTPLIKLAP